MRHTRPRSPAVARAARRDATARARIRRIVAGLLLLSAGELALVRGGAARGEGFLDQVAAGRAAAVAAGVTTASDAAARGVALQGALDRPAAGSAGFTIGATLAALDADLAGAASRGTAGRALVAQRVRALLAAQAEVGIGNRALCLLSGRTEPKSLERQVRLVEPRWSCEHG